jgi:hypothetical protein
MPQGFCCYSPNDTPLEDLKSCECVYFRDIHAFHALFSDSDGNTWCQLHAPIDRTYISGHQRYASQSELFLHAVNGARQLNRKVDLKRTVWLELIESTFLRELNTAGAIDEIDFSGAHFVKGLRWNDQTFDLKFQKTVFGGDSIFGSIKRLVDFSSSTFNASLTFKTVFSEARLEKAEINDNLNVETLSSNAFLNLKSAKLGSVQLRIQDHQSAKVDLCDAVIDRNLVIQISARGVLESLCAENLNVKGTAAIQGGQTGSLNFSSSRVGNLNLECNVRQKAIFTSSKIEGRLKANDSEFAKKAFFDKIDVEGNLDFKNTIFQGGAEFSNSTIRGLSSFRNAAFLHSTNFLNVLFCEDVSFRPGPSSDHPVKSVTNAEREIFRQISFDRSTFWKSVAFTNREFEGPLSCRETVFHMAPGFHGCKFHQDTSFRGAKFLDVTSEGATEAYRTLKLAMESARAKDEEARFYSLEQRSWRHHAKNSPALVAVSYFYDLGSEYGRNIGRPLGWTAAFAAIFSFVYLGALSWEFGKSIDFCVSTPPSGSSLPSWEISIRHMFTQIVRPFEALALRAGSYGGGGSGACVIPGWLASISTVQTLLHLGSIALVFLAIRRRFKMD